MWLCSIPELSAKLLDQRIFRWWWELSCSVFTLKNQARSTSRTSHWGSQLDGSTIKLGIDFWHDNSESIVTKISILKDPNCSKEKVISESYVDYALTGRGPAHFSFLLQVLYAICYWNHHSMFTLFYWPTIHYSISKICPEFQVLSSHFSEVYVFSMSFGQKWAMWKYSTPIYVQCDSMYRSKFCCQELWAAYCAFPIRRQSLPAACHLVEENLLAFLRCWLSSRVKNVLMLCKLGSDEYSSCEIKFSMELAGSYCWPKLCSLLRSIFRSYIGLWVKIWHGNKSVCFELNHVQISSSKRTTDQRKGRLLRFE